MMFSFMFAEGSFPRFMGRVRSGRTSRGSKAPAQPVLWLGPARRKGAGLNPVASGPKPMKNTDGLRLRTTSRTYRHFRTAFVLSTRMATATLAGNRHRSTGTDRRRDKLRSEYAAEAARRDADQQKQARDMQKATWQEREKYNAAFAAAQNQKK